LLASAIALRLIAPLLALPNTNSSAGKSYVVFGKADSSAIDLSVIADANNPLGGFVINGEAADDYSGSSVSSDLNCCHLDQHT
jgi:hypothetical protein